jgi:tetratricopeptide (TPR) repeat protein
MLLAILALAAALRLAHVLAMRRLPLFEDLVVDSAVYDAWASRIVSGDWIGSGAFYQDPLYPYFLAGLYSAFGRDLLLVRVVQIALGVATCALVATIATRAAGRVAGNVAALLLAVYRPAIFQEGELEKTALGVFLLTAVLALMTSSRRGAKVAAGAVLGLAALTRGNLLLMAPIAAIAIVLEPADGPPSPRSGWKERLAHRLRSPSARTAAGFLAAFALVLAPVTIRNHHVSGEWIATTYGAGAVFYTGNNPANASGGFEDVPFVRSDPVYEESDFRAAAESASGRKLSPKEISAFWFREALAHVARNPGFAALVTLRKVAMFIGDYEVPDAWDLYFLERYSPVLRLPLLGMGGLLALAVLGAVLAWRTSPVIRLTAVFAGAYALSVVVFFVLARYRLYVAPALAILAATGIAALIRAPRRLRGRTGLSAIVAAAAVGALSFSALGTPPKREHLYSFVGLATLYARAGDLASAMKLLGEAQARVPNAPEVLFAMGKLQLDGGDPRRAAENLRRCIEVNPMFPSAWYWLGIANYRSGDRDGAEQAFRRQLAIVPGHAESLTWLRLIGG